MDGKIGFCGNYDFNREALNGQSIKTEFVTEALKRHLPEKEFQVVNTRGWKKNPISLLNKLISIGMHCSVNFVFPDHKGVQVIVPILSICRKFTKNDVYYIVIGGWLYELLQTHRWLIKYLKGLTGIYVETSILCTKLNSLGLNNVKVLRNFKNYSENEVKRVPISSEILHCCFFARVTEKKGIYELIEIIKDLNHDNEQYHLDIYGPLETDEKKFYDSISDCRSIQYKGCAGQNEGANILAQYDLLVFPTKFFTEGIPGTIIDSYFAGTPVLSSNWESAEEVVINHETGLLYEFDNPKDLMNKLLDIYSHRCELEKMRKRCKEESRKYSEETALQDLLKDIK